MGITFNDIKNIKNMLRICSPDEEIKELVTFPYCEYVICKKCWHIFRWDYNHIRCNICGKEIEIKSEIVRDRSENNDRA